MIRRISTKWVLAVLGAVVVPFAGLALFVHTQVRNRLAGEVVRYHLLSMVADLTDRVDALIGERWLDLELLGANSMIGWQLDDHLQHRRQGARALDAPTGIWDDYVQEVLDRFVKATQVYDLVLTIDADGHLVARNRISPLGRPYPEEIGQALAAKDYSAEPWFRAALGEGRALIEQHASPLARQEPGQEPDPSDFQLGFAARVELEDRPGRPGEGVGVLLLLMNWSHVQGEIANYGVRRLEERSGVADDVVREDMYQSSYAWIWAADADTILAHADKRLYGQRVSQPPVDLPQMVAAARAGRWGMYPDYTFRGQDKKAAFKHCLPREEGGFGWVVGIGVDEADIYRPVEAFLGLLLTVSGAVLLLAVTGTVLLARRFVRPIHALQEHTRRIAGGDLDARIAVDRHDELGELAESFNSMTGELKANREQLVRAEKEAAWREMARQVAHEIKNPLTPINLSVGLLRRSHRERSPDFESIFERTLDMIQRQVAAMREIANDFYAFAGEHKSREPIDVGRLLDEVLEWNEAWAADLGVSLQRRGGSGIVVGDAAELSRALQNLVANALEAMTDGGELHARVTTTIDEVCIELRDTGPGIAPDVESRLFEPYFTTRSSGTGLGLAIVRRVIEDMGGRVELTPTEDGRGGARALIVLPRAGHEGGAVDVA